MIKKLLLLILISLPLVAQNPSSQMDQLLVLSVNLTKTFNTADDRTYRVNQTIRDRDLGILMLQLTFEHQATGLWSLTSSVEDYPTMIELDGEMSKSNLLLMKFNHDGSLAWITDSVGTRIEQGLATAKVNYIANYSLKSFYLNLGTIGLGDGLIEGDEPSSLRSSDDDALSYESAL